MTTTATRQRKAPPQHPQQLTFASILGAGVVPGFDEEHKASFDALVSRAQDVLAYARNAKSQSRRDDKLDAMRRCGELADSLALACEKLHADITEDEPSTGAA